VADTKENTLFVFDLASGTPLAYIPTGRQPGQVVLLGARAFVSNFADGSLTVIDTSTNRPLKTLLAGGLGLALNGQSRRLYAAAGSRVVVLDPTTDTLVATLPVPPGANVWGLAVDPVANRVYATDLSSPRVLVYDGATNTLAAQIGLDAPGRLGIAVGPSGRVFVAGDTDTHAQLAIIDGAAAKVVARVPIPGFTRSLAVDPGGLVYAASGADGSVTAVDPVGGTASTVSVPQDAGRVIPPSSAKAVAISPTTGVLVIAASGGAAPPARPFVDPVPVIRL